jgi:hypothetical protein
MMPLTADDAVARVNQILRGREGHLFLAGGHHHVRDYFTGAKKPTDRSVEAFFANAEARRLFCAARGLEYEAVVFPEKLYALAELVDFPVISLLHEFYMSSSRNSGLTDPIYPKSVVGNSDSYAKTDTHLSHQGSMELLESILVPDFSDYWPGFLKHTDESLNFRQKFCGDLGRKFEPKIQERVTLYSAPSSYSVEHNGVSGMNDGLLCISVNEKSVTERRLLIFGDSFFRMLLPRLSYFYREIIFCRSRFFHYELIDLFGPDTVYTGTAERYLSGCVRDEERPHFLLIPLLKGKTSRPTPGFAQALSNLGAGLLPRRHRASTTTAVLPE